MRRMNGTRGPLTALNSAVALNVSNAESVMLQILCSAVAGLTVVLEGSIDSTDGVDGTWFAIAISPTNSTNLYTQVVNTGALAAQPAFAWFARVHPLRWVRARASAWTSGTAVVAVLQPSQGGV